MAAPSRRLGAYMLQWAARGMHALPGWRFGVRDAALCAGDHTDYGDGSRSSVLADRTSAAVDRTAAPHAASDAASRPPRARSAPSERTGTQSNMMGDSDMETAHEEVTTPSYGGMRVHDERAEPGKRTREEAGMEDDVVVAEDGMDHDEADADPTRHLQPGEPPADMGAPRHDRIRAVAAAAAHVASAAAQSNELVTHALAFVNRYAEALDVLVPNLFNHESLRADQGMPYRTPLAAQPTGTGKTALGRNITTILRRPREADAAAEATVAAQLRTAQCWREINVRLVDDALRDPRDENLLMRTLLVMFPHHAATLMNLKLVDPLIVRMTDLMAPEPGVTFSRALGYAIFCAARNDDDSASAWTAYVALNVSYQTAAGMVELLMEEADGAPLVLVLDDIQALQRAKYVDYFAPVQLDTALHRAMSTLSGKLKCLHRIPGCFVYCTGRLLRRTFLTLEGSTGTPLAVTPTLLHPLTARDVEQSLRLTVDATGRSLADSVGVAPDLVHFFAEQVAEVTGGVGEAIQCIVRSRQQKCVYDSRNLATHDEVRKLVDGLQSAIPSLPGRLLRVNWHGPGQAVEAKLIPAGFRHREAQVRLVNLFSRMLLLDVPFASRHAISIGEESLQLVDAAVVLGFSYGPAVMTDDAASPSASRDAKATRANDLRLIAGSWLCRSLENDIVLESEPAALATAQLLGSISSLGGTMRGRPFQMFCADALCHRTLLTPGATLAQLLPLRNRSVRASDVVPRLRVVALPSAASGSTILNDDSKAALMRSPGAWMGAATIHTDDLPWLLSKWLPEGSIGVPVHAQASSQDFFLRLSGGVIGFALKEANESAGTDWADLRDELSKAPLLRGTPYCLIVCSTYLAPEVSAALRSAESGVFKPGLWYLRDGVLVQDGASAKLKFMVPGSVQELVVSNPVAPLGGGLNQLLGSRLLVALDARFGGSTSTTSSRQLEACRAASIGDAHAEYGIVLAQRLLESFRTASISAADAGYGRLAEAVSRCITTNF